jgi:hypothetical protein
MKCSFIFPIIRQTRDSLQNKDVTASEGGSRNLKKF